MLPRAGRTCATCCCGSRGSPTTCPKSPTLTSARSPPGQMEQSSWPRGSSWHPTSRRIRSCASCADRSFENSAPVRGGGDCLGPCASWLEPTGDRRGPVHDCAGARHSEDGLHTCMTERVSCLGQFLAREGDDPIHSADTQHHAPLANAVHPQ